MVEPLPRPPGTIVAVANFKGGTGKSTIAVNLACLATREHSPVLLVDADPQGTASAWLEDGNRPEGLTVEAWPLSGDPDAWADRVFAAARAHSRVVIDAPPELGATADAALALVDALVIPVTPSAIDLRATAKTLKQVRRIQRLRDGRPACLLVPNRVDQRTALGRGIQQALRDLDLVVAPPIAQRATHAAAFASGQWIGAYAPGSPAFREMAAVVAKLEPLLAGLPTSDYRPAVVARRGSTPDRGSLPRAASIDRRSDDDAGVRRAGWFANLVSSLRLLGRPHAG
jgi:chromosome partitioning protein